MTIVYRRTLPTGEAGTHALVMGVGSYPHLAKGGSSPPDLKGAPAGAKLIANWLIENADALTPRLASLDLIISPPAEAQGEFVQPPGASSANDPRGAGDVNVEPAKALNVKAAGVRWRQATLAVPGNVPILYVSGHGVATPSRTMVFLADTNADPNEPWNPHVDLQEEAMRIKREPAVPLACIFIDACQEVISEVDLAASDRRGIVTSPVRIWAAPGSADSDLSNVYALVPGPRGALAFDDGSGGGGRFTHILVQALNGAAACNYDGMGKWGVQIDDLHLKMRGLYGLRRDEWHESMEPTPIYMPVAEHPLVTFGSAPRVPICLRIDPPDALPAANRLYVRTRPAPVVPEDPTELVYQAAVVPGAAPAASAAAAARTSDVVIAWPNARMGAHFVYFDFGPPATWPGTTRRTQIDISEMRVRPWIVHNVG